jgi:integrase
MTSAYPLPAHADVAAAEDETVAAHLWSLITQEFLDLMGWSHEWRVAYFPADNPLLGPKRCIVTGCGIKANSRLSLCPYCLDRWNASGEQSIIEFAQAGRPWVARGAGRCAVPACDRPWASRFALLCRKHHDQRTRILDVPMDVFLGRSDTEPFDSLGPCQVPACTRDRDIENIYCGIHRMHWNKLVFASPTGAAGLDEPHFRRTSSAIPTINECSLRGLPNRIVAELLLGIQQRTAWGAQTYPDWIRPLVAKMLADECTSIEQLDQSGLSSKTGTACRHIVKEVRRAQLSPETERLKDNWDATVFGYDGVLKFGDIVQPWLRESAKIWAYNDLPKRRSLNAKQIVQNEIRILVRLSESLKLQRPGDRGLEPHLLSRSDICGFMNRLTFLCTAGTITSATRAVTIQSTRRLLANMRALGLTRVGEPMYGLPDDFILYSEDVPMPPDVVKECRDLPVEVMRHICEHLDGLEEVSTREIRVAVELIIDTGRRPDEICRLTLDCLERDAQGKPVLVYTNFKEDRYGCRLPISEATAAIIIGQRERVRLRYPNEPTAALKLIAAPTRNPHGTRALNDNYLGSRHREWLLTLPDVTVPMTVEEGGVRVTKLLPFNRSQVFLYAYRHTYAQRHADAGVGVDVLCELMGHRFIGTTQLYYRVGEDRRREAVDRLATLHFDRHGNKIWRAAAALLDSEHVRLAVGQVAVPYGSCSEPSNVAAGGHDCPIRFRCVGCTHFATDVSYLPDLEGYLASLLRSRERIRGAFGADDWAKAEALPSDTEIARIRRLIVQIKTEVDGLSESDRALVEESVSTVRKGRSAVVGLETPRVRQPVPDVRPDRST